MESISTARRRPEGAVFSSWPAPDGWKMRRMDWPQPPGAAQRGVLVFAGGRGDFIEKYLEAYGHWHARGWAITAFDWRGQGGSRGDAASATASFDSFVEDLAALAASVPGQPRVAIGHSMGGHVLLRALAEQRLAFDAAVLVAPMIAVNSAPLPHPLARLLTGLVCRLGLDRAPLWRPRRGRMSAGSLRRRHLTGSIERYADEAWWLGQEPDFQLGPPNWGWLRAAWLSAAALAQERLAGIATPILILAAARDRLVSLAAIRRAAASLPDARLHVYPGVAHEILRDRDKVRDDALARIDAFLATRAP